MCAGVISSRCFKKLRDSYSTHPPNSNDWCLKSTLAAMPKTTPPKPLQLSTVTHACAPTPGNMRSARRSPLGENNLVRNTGFNLSVTIDIDKGANKCYKTENHRRVTTGHSFSRHRSFARRLVKSGAASSALAAAVMASAGGGVAIRDATLCVSQNAMLSLSISPDSPNQSATSVLAGQEIGMLCIEKR